MLDASGRIEVERISLQGEPMAQDRVAIVRMELDIPTALVTPYGHTENESGKSLENMISAAFHIGEVVTVHIVVESTGIRREVCHFIDPQSQYKAECGNVMQANGVCKLQASHNEKLSHQLELAEAE